MKELWLRLKMDTPKFFKKLRAIGLWLTGVSASFYAAAAAFPDLHIPKWVSTPLGYSTLAGVIIVTLASFPVSNPEELEKKLNQ